MTAAEATKAGDRSDGLFARTRLQHGQPFGLTVCACKIDGDADLPLDAAFSVLSPEERERADRFRSPRDRDRHIRASAFVRFCLASVTATEPASLRFGTVGNGKPVLACVPGPYFNLSHSEGVAVLAISTAPVGIDLELPTRKIDPLALAGTVFTAAEESMIADLPDGERLRRFLMFWTAKEARMKLTGEGMRLTPRSIALNLSDGQPIGYLSPPTPVARLAYIDIGVPDALCAVATSARE